MEGPSENLQEISVDHETGEENYVTLSFSNQDPLGLNDLNDQVPTYNYSLDDGLHNFVIPVSSSNSSQFVVASNTFSLAPLVKREQGMLIINIMYLHSTLKSTYTGP